MRCNRLLYQDKGFVYKLLPVLVSLSLVAVLVVMSAGFFRAFRQRDAVSQLTREYLLVMETEGYLSQARQEELLISLEEAGLEQISLEGTTLFPVSYGSRISLCVNGVLPQEFLGQYGMTWELPVSVRLSSTAKQ
ncbi:MAG: hypothetical protein LUC90_02160 [Lachnospiraceae bacterium]|nr:hypothetical protein [Lachnospiraceae bacterium]